MDAGGRVAFLDLLEQLFHQRDDDFVVQLIQRLLRPSFDVAHFPHHDVHLAFEFGLLGRHAIDLRLGHLAGVRF